VGALGFALSGVGLILVWAGVKGEDLREVVTGVFSGKRKFVDSAAPTAAPVDRTTASYRAGQEEQADRLGGGRVSGTTSTTAPPGTVIGSPPGGVAGRQQG
jgi:hypothetical protein